MCGTQECLRQQIEERERQKREEKERRMREDLELEKYFQQQQQQPKPATQQQAHFPAQSKPSSQSTRTVPPASSRNVVSIHYMSMAFVVLAVKVEGIGLHWLITCGA